MGSNPLTGLAHLGPKQRISDYAPRRQQMKGVPTRQTLGRRGLSPVKYMKKRAKRFVVRSPEDLQRIIDNAAFELANKRAHEASYFTSNF